MIKKVIAPLIIGLLSALLLISFINSCRHESMIAQIPLIKFDTQILPIFQDNCSIAGCHDGLPGHAKLNLTDYNHIFKGVVPGQPYSSRIYTAIIAVYGRTMPPTGPLNEPQRVLIKVWIEQGAKNISDTSHTTSGCDSIHVTLSGTLNNILNTYCLACHSNVNAPNRGANIKLQDSVDIAAKANRLVGSLQHNTGYFAMPLGLPKLNPCQIAQFAEWVKKLGVVDTTKPPVLAGYACFTRDILPIIQNSCSMSNTNCHNGSGEESFPLQDYDQIRQIVIPGHPDNSSLYVVITNPSENFMPPSPYAPLPQSNIDSIYSWIMHGAKNEACTEICDTTKFTFKNDVSPVIIANCRGCHSGSSANKGIRLEDYATIYAVATSNGQLVKSITGNGSLLMPPGNQLSSCNIRVIEKWVQAGAPNNK